MIIYYPTYYLVPVAPLIPLDEVDYNLRYNEYYIDPYNDECRAKYNMERTKVYIPYRSIHEDIFYEIDEEYVNECIK